MFLSIFQLMVLVALFLAGVGLGDLCSRLFGWSRGVAEPLFAAIMVFAFASPMFRRLRFRPIFLPRCPSCQKRGPYRIDSGGWPVQRVTCDQCGKELEVRFRKVVSSSEGNTRAVVQSRWPAFLGNWKRVA